MHIHQEQRLVQLKPEEMREKGGSWLETLTLSMESWLHTRGKRPNASNSGPKGFTHILLPEAPFPTPKNSCRAAKKAECRQCKMYGMSTVAPDAKWAGLREEVGYLKAKFLTERTRNKVKDFVSFVFFWRWREAGGSFMFRKYMPLTNFGG